MKSFLCFLLATTAFTSVHAQLSPEEAEATYHRAVERFINRDWEVGLIILDSAIVAMKLNEMYEAIIYAEIDGVMAREDLGASPIESFAGYERIINELLPRVDPGAMHAKTYFDFGALCYQLGEHSRAQDNLQKAERIMASFGDGLKLERAYVFDTMSSVAESMGSLEQSRTYALEALSIMVDLGMYDHPFGVLLRCNYVLSLIGEGEYDEAESYLKALLDLFPSLDDSDYNSRTAILYAEAKWLASGGEFERAYQRLIIIERDYPEKVLRVAERFRLINEKVHLLPLTKRPTEAEQLLLNALADSSMATLRPRIYKLLSKHYYTIGSPSLAVKYAELCRKMMITEQLDEVTTMSDFSGGVMPVLSAMTTSVAALEALADSSGSPEHWFEVLQAVQYSEQVFMMMRRKARVGELISLREAGWFKVYESGMRAAHILYRQDSSDQYLNAAWNISEYAKSAVLLSSVNRANPDTLDRQLNALIRKEIALKTKISYLESLQDKGTAGRQHGHDIVKLNQALDSVFWFYEWQFPAYAVRRFSPPTATLEQVHAYAKEKKTGIMAYFFGETFVFALSVQDDKSRFEMLNSPEVLIGLIGKYRKLINQRPALQGYLAQVDEIDDVGHQLYQQLFQGITESENIQPATLILPDGPLNYVPFEALPVKAKGTGKFLVYHTDISYAYGFTSLYLSDSGSRPFRQKLLALAPQFGASADDPGSSVLWSAIPGAQHEIDVVSNLFRPHLTRSAVSNYDWFMQHKGRSEIMHLATHAFVNEKDPFRSGLLLNGGPNAGREGVLYASDLYHLSIPASLVVLSACNTGSGPVKRGEGVMSLAHGFSYAGSASVVMTLWPANDKTTAQLIGHFYQSLAGGNSKSRALNEAKRHYLSEADAYQSHPYFWAGMVLIGDASALDLGRDQAWLWWLWLVVIGVVLIVSLAIFRHRRRRVA